MPGAGTQVLQSENYFSSVTLAQLHWPAQRGNEAMTFALPIILYSHLGFCTASNE